MIMKLEDAYFDESQVAVSNLTMVAALANLKKMKPIEMIAGKRSLQPVTTLLKRFLK